MSNYVVIIPVEEKKTVLVSPSEAEMLKKVYRINVEIRRDVDGKPKVFKVSREIEK